MAAICLWVRSEQRRHRATLFGLAAIVALGIGPTLALAGGARRAETVYERFESRTNAATLAFSPIPEVFRLDGTGGWSTLADSNRHLEILDQVRAIDGVESVHAAIWAGARPIIEGEAPSANASGLQEAFSGGYRDIDPVHPPFFVVAGTLPAPDDPRGVVMNEAAASRAGIRIGDTVDFETVDPSQFTEWIFNTGHVRRFGGPTISTEVRAIVRIPLDLAEPGRPEVVLMPGVVAAMGDRFANCTCWVEVRTESGRVDEVRAGLEAIYGPYGLAPGPADSAGAATAAIGVEATTLWMAALVASVAALVVVAQVTARSVSSMATSNDARRALGMDRRQRACGAALVLAPALAAGTAFGCVLAYLLSGLFPRGLALRAEPDPGLRLDPAVLGLGGTGFLVAEALIVSVVAWRTAGVAKPGTPKAKRTLPRVFSGNPQRALGVSFAIDPVGGRRTPVVALTTLMGVALASGAIVAVTTIQRSLDEARSDRSIFGAPADFLYFDNGSVGAVAAGQVVDRQRGITDVTRTIAGQQFTATATGPAGARSLVEPTAFEPLRGTALPTLMMGSMPTNDDQVALGPATAEELGAGLHDTVRLADASQSTHDFRVVGLLVSWGQDDPGHAVVVTAASVRRLACPGGVDRGCDLMVSLWVQPTSTAAAEALTAAGFERIARPANLDRLEEVGNIPWYLAGALGALGSAGLVHALATASRRRRIDLAIGRALGWSPRQAAGVLVWQAVLSGLFGGLAGLALGLVVGRGLWIVLANGLDIVIRPATPLGLATLTLAGVVAASVVLALPAFLLACRRGVGQTLRAE